MASGSLLPPNTSDHTLSNGISHTSPDATMNSLPDPFGSESPLSEPDLPSDNGITAAGASADYASEDELAQEMATSDLDDEDEDAVGEKDEEYTEDSNDAAASEEEPPSRRSSSSTEASTKSLKRKASAEDDEYMLQNPELYGLRRSGRARPTRQTLDDSDDDDEDVVYASRRNKRAKVSRSRLSSNKNSTINSAEHSSEDSGDDEDTYGGARGRALVKKNRRKMKNGTSGYGTPTDNLRFSDRNRGGKIANYIVDQSDDEDLMEEDTTPAYWADQPADTRPAIDRILDHRLREGVDTQDPGKDDYEYKVKYQGKAPIHAAWEPRSELTQPRVGYRRFDNYYNKVVRAEKIIMDEAETSMEERERWLLERETAVDALAENVKIERIIGKQMGTEGVEYLVKWKALPYEEATWEKESFIVEKFERSEINKYLDRAAQLPQCDKKQQNPATRTKLEERLKVQPEHIKHGQLRQFQLDGLSVLIARWSKNQNQILADEMGLGKTVQTVAFLNYLIKDHGQEGPFLVVVPLSTLPAWADTFNNWTPNINYVIYGGNTTSREIIREYEMCLKGDPRKPKFNVLLTTYEYINTDKTWLSQYKWQCMVVDEAHRLKNRDSQLYDTLDRFSAAARLLITGTPIQNDLHEFAALMEFIAPGEFTVDPDLDLDSKDAESKFKEFHKLRNQYLLARTKEEVEKDLPSKTEKIIRVPLTELQVEFYQHIITRNYEALNAGPKAPKASLLNIMMELKKVSNHLLLNPNAEERLLPSGNDVSREEHLKALITGSGKMMLLDRLLTKLKKDGHRVLIFSQMVKMLDLLSDYMQLRGHTYQRLDGTMSSASRKIAIDHYNGPDSKDFVFLLSTRAGGLGINLMTADTVILFDSDWNPQADLQAMARAHRIGQKKPVMVYRLVSKDSIEEEVIERAKKKRFLEFAAMKGRNTGSNDFLFAKVEKSAVTPSNADDISEILKKRGQKMFEQSGNQKTLDELDIDDVLAKAEVNDTAQPEGLTSDGSAEFLRNFEYTDVKLEQSWDEIIPPEQMKMIRAEQKNRTDQSYLEAVIAQNQPRKRKTRIDDDESRDQRAAKKRARELAAQAAETDESDGDEETSDPKRALNEKECRNLVRAFERYGYVEDKQAEILRDAKLLNRNVDLVKSTMQQILSKANELLQEEKDRIAELERLENRAMNKKDKASSLLFDFKGVKRLNAQTLVERPEDLRMLRACIAEVDEVSAFRISEATKSASYSCEWGSKEDGMLAAGVAKHGYGAWTTIRDDPELGLQDKMFLEEHRVDAKDKRAADQQARSPGAVHLVRRIGYLFSVLRDKTSGGTNEQAKKALENHHRSKPKAEKARTSTPSGRGSEAPAPRKSGLAKRRSPEDRPSSSAGQNAVRKGAIDKAQIIALLQPIESTLKGLQNCTRKLIPSKTERATTLRNHLLALGDYLKENIPAKFDDSAVWNYISKHHWVRTSKEDQNVSGDRIAEMYARLIADKKGGVEAASSEAPRIKKESPITSSIPKEELPAFKKRDAATPDLPKLASAFTDRRDERRDTSSSEHHKNRHGSDNVDSGSKAASSKSEKKSSKPDSRAQSDRHDRHKSNDRVDSYRPVDRRERSPDRRDSRDYRDYRDRRPPQDRRGSDHRDMPRGSEYRSQGRREDRREDRRDPRRYSNDLNGRNGSRKGSDLNGPSSARPDNLKDGLSKEAPHPAANGHKLSDLRPEHPLPSKPEWQKRQNHDANGSREDRPQVNRPGSSGGDFYRGSAYSDRPPSRGQRDNFDDRRFDERYDDYYHAPRYRERDDFRDRDRDRGYYDRRR